jgi:MFS family permease
MRQPTFVVAVTSGMVGYGGMAFLMTVTPLAVVACGYPFESAAFVIQWHVLAMFAPSFVTGTLIQRYGVLNIMLCGAGLFAAAVLVGISGTAVWQFWLGLVLVGLAWNFLYVGATTLVTETYRPSEKAKVQAANDFLLFLSVVIGAMSSGAIHNWVGWAPLNLVAVPFLVCATGGLIWLRGQRRRLAPA